MTKESDSPELLHVFLCHSFIDKDPVRSLYRRLIVDGFGPWLDEEDLLPGQDWRREIPKAVRNSEIVLVCLSKSSISKSGYVQKEIKLALDVAEEQPEGTIYVIPVKLEDCEVPDRLSGWQWVNLFEQGGYEKLIQSLHLRVNTLGRSLSKEASTNYSSPPQTPVASFSSPAVTVTVKPADKSLEINHVEQHSFVQQSIDQAPTSTDAIDDFAIELGDHRTRVLCRKRGVLLSEPSMVAINRLTNKLEAIGVEAETLSASENTVIHYPLKDGKVADVELAARMLQHFLDKICGEKRLQKSRAVVAVPSELTQIERRAVIDAVYRAQIGEVYLVERILCAALGSGLSVKGTRGSMIVYVSESATEVMANSHGYPTSFEAIGIGIKRMMEEVIRYIERKYNLLVGEQTAESIWIALGSAYPLEKPLAMNVRGRNLIEGIPKTLSIEDEEIREALSDSIQAIVMAVRQVLERTPPEVSADLIGRGITLTGAGAKLMNFDTRLSIETGLPVWIPEDPMTSVVKGASEMFTNSNLVKEERYTESLNSILAKAFNFVAGSILSFPSSDLAIDIGAKNTLIYARRRGIVVSEPSLVAVSRATYKVEAVGRDAKEMLGRTPGSIDVIHPIKNGVIFNFDIAVRMLSYFIRKAHGGKRWVRPRIVIPIRSGLSKVERAALETAAYAAKASEVFLVDEAICAAIGSGLPITESYGNMIVDIGGSATDIAVISLSGVVYSRSVRVAGGAMDDAITHYVKRKYNILIGERTAEAIKIQLGSAYPLDVPLSFLVHGRNLFEHVPTTITITDEEVREALAEPVREIITAIRVALRQTPPQLISDILERGIVLTGAGALLQNIDKRLALETGIPVSIADDPLASVILGAGKMLSDFGLLAHLKQEA